MNKWAAVALLWFVCFFNYADRQAIYSVFPLLKTEMGLTDVAQLDRLGARVFVVATSTDYDISTVQADAVTWRRPSLALIRATSLGLASSVGYFSQSLPVIRGRGGVEEKLQLDLAAVPPMQEVVDAMLYLGPPSSITHSRLPRELCADPIYFKMRVERLNEFASFGSDPAAAFKAECAAVLK